MARHRRLPTLRGQLWRALSRSLALTVGTSLLVIGGAGAAYVADRHGEVPASVGSLGQSADASERRLMARFDCATEGYAASVTPLSALVRLPGGGLRVVAFDEGWRLHTRGGSTRLVAVCLEPAT